MNIIINCTGQISLEKIIIKDTNMRHEDVEGEAEGNDEDRENQQHLQESVEDLQKHDDVDSDAVKPVGTPKDEK